MRLPHNSVLISHLLVVQYMTPEGEIRVESEARDCANEELDFGTTLELVELARIEAVTPFIAKAVARQVGGDDA